MGTAGPGQIVAALGVELAVIDAVGARNGQASVSEAFKRESDAAKARAAGLVSPVVGAVLAWCLVKWGLEGVRLDSEHPFSDESLSAALSAVLGVPVASVRNREALKDAFRRAITLRVSQEVGSPFEDVFDRQKLRRDTLRAVGSHSSEIVPGLELRDLSDRGQTINDAILYATRRVSDLLGINFTDLRSAHAIKEDIYAWAMPQIRQEVEGDESAGRYYKKPLKMDKKSVRNREAQRRFRAKWGKRRKYRKLEDG